MEESLANVIAYEGTSKYITLLEGCVVDQIFDTDRFLLTVTLARRKEKTELVATLGFNAQLSRLTVFSAEFIECSWQKPRCLLNDEEEACMLPAAACLAADCMFLVVHIYSQVGTLTG